MRTVTSQMELADDEIVRRKETEFTPMTEEEALIQIDLLGHDFFAYTDRSSSLSSTRTMWPLTRTVTSQIAGSGLAGFFSV